MFDCLLNNDVPEIFVEVLLNMYIARCTLMLDGVIVFPSLWIYLMDCIRDVLAFLFDLLETSLSVCVSSVSAAILIGCLSAVCFVRTICN
jgi:hypothetical protein